jgi:outer membrane protein assembly factor BamE (lipoprotein component of BamABCDE complex)
MASDVDRITQLEKEVQELKLRLSNLETPQSKASLNQKPSISPDGWKTLANWRSLKNGMSYDDVRAILGEPSRINGGNMAYWFYPNQSGVVFYKDKLDTWFEPK